MLRCLAVRATFGLVSSLLAWGIAHAAAGAPLPPSLLRALANAKVPSDHVSIYVRDASTNEVLIDLSADEPRSPASTIKVLTTFAALDMLGPAYTWKTRAYARGRLSNGVLHGDLILHGGGDPYMTGERWWMFVQNLRQRGLTKVTGDVVIDNSFFAPPHARRADFDAQPFRSYNVLPDALMVNFQTSRFTISALPQQSQPQVSVNPLPANLVIKNQLRLGTGKCQGYNRGVSFDMPDENDPTTLVIRGVFPAACGDFSINRAIMAPPEYAYGTFRTLWMQSGGVIDGDSRMGLLPADARLIYEHESLPLSEIVRLVNKFSNNVMARHLLLTLAAEKSGTPASLDNGQAAIRTWLANRRIEMPGFVLENGSGLSRNERLTARGLGEMLDVAWHNPFMPEFAASLPLSALDGTLRNRFKSPGMEGRIRLKTGRLDHVSGLAGFVNSASGKTYVVVIFVNHPGAHQGSGDAVQTELVRWVFAQ